MYLCLRLEQDMKPLTQEFFIAMARQFTPCSLLNQNSSILSSESIVAETELFNVLRYIVVGRSNAVEVIMVLTKKTTTIIMTITVTTSLVIEEMIEEAGVTITFLTFLRPMVKVTEEADLNQTLCWVRAMTFNKIPQHELE